MALAARVALQLQPFALRCAMGSAPLLSRRAKRRPHFTRALCRRPPRQVRHALIPREAAEGVAGAAVGVAAAQACRRLGLGRALRLRHGARRSLDQVGGAARKVARQGGAPRCAQLARQGHRACAVADAGGALVAGRGLEVGLPLREAARQVQLAAQPRGQGRRRAGPCALRSRPLLRAQQADAVDHGTQAARARARRLLGDRQLALLGREPRAAF
mmetsp:Transcript_21740/g.49959  ORF Transcript_21740/g.49959 Transcript_21740/m.49959 type:complete len:216 (-) Transcript_21740:924-1571(-)